MAMNQVVKIWKHLLASPALNQTPMTKEESIEETQKGKRQKTAQGRGKGQGKGANQSKHPTAESLVETIQLLKRLVLQHEDSINAQLTEAQFLIHFNMGEGSIVQDMFQASKDWQQLQEKTVPLRHHLVKVMMGILHQRLTLLANAAPTDAIRTDCAKYHLVNAQGQMPYLAWNPQTKMLEPTKDKPLDLQETLRCINNIIRLLEEPQVTVRFHSLKRSEGVPTQAVPWLWVVSMRSNPELWHEVKTLCYHSSWQLIMARIKPQGHQRSNLAQRLSQV